MKISLLLLAAALSKQVAAFTSIPSSGLSVSRLSHTTSSLMAPQQAKGALFSNHNNDHHDDEAETATAKNHHWAKKTAGIALASTAIATMAFPHAAMAVPDIAQGGAMMDSLSQTGFYQAFSLVFLSEIGDKTFFIAGLLAMKTSRLVSYIGSMGALAAMTVLSVLIGQIFHAAPAGLTQGLPLDDICAVLAFAFFGYKTLKEALEDDDVSFMDEELAEAEEEVEGSKTVTQSNTWYVRGVVLVTCLVCADILMLSNTHSDAPSPPQLFS